MPSPSTITVRFDDGSEQVFTPAPAPAPLPEPEPEPEPLPPLPPEPNPPTIFKPDPSNVGLSDPAALVTQSTKLVVLTHGAVVENLSLPNIEVKANNVTIRNCLIRGSTYNVRATFGFTGLVIEHCEFRNASSSGFYGSGATLRRCHLHSQIIDAIKPNGDVLVEECYIEKCGSLEGSHADGVQMVAGSNVTLRGNVFHMPHDEPGFMNSQCIIVQSNNGPVNNILVEGNWINGGGYSVQFRDKGTGYGPPTNVRILNNRFGRDFQFGTHIIDEGAGYEWSGNVWDDTGLPIE